MSDTLLVHRLGAPPIELARSQCHLFSRSQMLLGQTCAKKREFAYHWQGRGVESTLLSEDLALGTAVHAGLEVLLRDHYVLDEPEYGGSWNDFVNSGANEANQVMMEQFRRGLEMQQAAITIDPQSETAQLLAEEQANLAYALVWTFGRRRLASLLERFEVVKVEPEICWLVGSILDGVSVEFVESSYYQTHIVMMSRPDAILRSRSDGKLWTVSWKTAKRFDGGYVERFESDVQSLTEGLAVQAKYGEAPAGTLYTYFLKGDKTFDPETGAKRYTSPLVRPYCNWTGVGEPQYRGAYKWFDEMGTEKRCGKGWERIDIWKSFEMPEWLELLDSGAVHPEANRDWLGEAVVEPDPRPFNPEYAERWRQKAVQQEGDWIAILQGDRMATQDETGCHVYNRKCTYYGVCWRGETIEDQIASGYKRLRQESNHPAEFGEETIESDSY